MPRDRVLFEFELHWHCHHKNVQSDSILKGKNVNEYDRWKVNVFDRIRTFLNFVYISILYLLVGIGVRLTRWNTESCLCANFLSSVCINYRLQSWTETDPSKEKRNRASRESLLYKNQFIEPWRRDSRSKDINRHKYPRNLAQRDRGNAYSFLDVVQEEKLVAIYHYDTRDFSNSPFIRNPAVLNSDFVLTALRFIISSNLRFYLPFPRDICQWSRYTYSQGSNVRSPKDMQCIECYPYFSKMYVNVRTINKTTRK